MLRSLKVRAQLQRKAGEIYGAIVTQARQPDFYAKLGIQDTPVGRYELVVLHLFLVLERLRQEGAAAGTLPRILVEMFVTDMDDSLREMGTGDVGVAKKVRRAAAGLYERSADYRRALETGEERELARALAAHVAGVEAGGRLSEALARYVRAAAVLLAQQDGVAMLAGQITFPPVTTFAETR